MKQIFSPLSPPGYCPKVLGYGGCFVNEVSWFFQIVTTCNLNHCDAMRPWLWVDISALHTDTLKATNFLISIFTVRLDIWIRIHPPIPTIISIPWTDNCSNDLFNAFQPLCNNALNINLTQYRYYTSQNKRVNEWMNALFTIYCLLLSCPVV